jgi:hypothetical protein
MEIVDRTNITERKRELYDKKLFLLHSFPVSKDVIYRLKDFGRSSELSEDIDIDQFQILLVNMNDANTRKYFGRLLAIRDFNSDTVFALHQKHENVDSGWLKNVGEFLSGTSVQLPDLDKIKDFSDLVLQLSNVLINAPDKKWMAVLKSIWNCLK